MNRPRTLVLMLAASLLTGCAVKVPVAGRVPRTDFGKATGPDGWEAAFLEALSKKDYDGMDRHMTTNYVWSGPSGRFDKQQTLALFRRFDITSYQMSDVQVLPQGNDFIVSYRLHVNGTFDGKPIEHPDSRLVSVWQVQKRGGALITQGEWLLQP